jgi:hypothetical protein
VYEIVQYVVEAEKGCHQMMKTTRSSLLLVNMPEKMDSLRESEIFV